MGAVLDQLPDRERRRLAIYLLEAPQIRFTMERIPDVLDGEDVPLTGGLRSDGVWFWRSDLAHYVLKYGVAVPEEFLAHAAENRWTPPSFTEDELSEIAAKVRELGA